MNTNYLFRRIGGFVLALALVAGVFMVAGGSAQAQGRFHRRVIVVAPVRRPFGFGWGWGNPYYPYGYNPYYSQYVFGSAESAESQGYHDGMKVGSDDGRKGKSFNPERSHYYQDAIYGNFGGAYREGFDRGYQAGYRA